METVPREILVVIFSFLEANDLRKIPLVCKHWWTLLREHDTLIWKGLYVIAFNHDKTNCPGASTWKENYRFYMEVENRWRNFKPTQTDSLIIHKERVSGVQYDLENDLLVTGGRDHLVKVTQLSKPKSPSILRGHMGPVFCIQFDYKLGKIVSSSEDTTVKVWSLNRKKLDYSLPAHTGPITRIQFDSQKILSCSDDTKVKMWDVETKKCLATYTDHTDEVWTLHYEDTTLATGSNDSTTKLWDFRTGKCFKSLGLTKTHVRSVYFSGDTLITTSFKDIVCYDLRAGKVRFQDKIDSWINYAKFDATKLVAIGQNAKIYIYDMFTGKPLATHTMENATSLICFQMDANNLMCGGQATGVRFFHFNPRTHPPSK